MCKACFGIDVDVVLMRDEMGMAKWDRFFCSNAAFSKSVLLVESHAGAASGFPRFYAYAA